MPKTSPKLKATKPKNVFEKPLQADCKALFKALSKGVGHTAIGKWEEIGNDTRWKHCVPSGYRQNLVNLRFSSSDAPSRKRCSIL
jgi:hypothetical protein